MSNPTDGVCRTDQCDLRVIDEPWLWADANREAIEAHWRESSRRNPKYFNGVVHVMLRCEITPDAILGELAQTDFASTLYWRHQGYPDTSVWDGFGAAVIRASCGEILLGRQSDGNLNAGLAYPPGGFIDDQDVRPGTRQNGHQAGRVDLSGSIEREIIEETGLNPAQLTREPGFIVSTKGQLVSISALYRSSLDAEALRNRVLAHIAAEAEPELADIIMMKDTAQADATAMPGYARQLVQYLLA